MNVKTGHLIELEPGQSFPEVYELVSQAVALAVKRKIVGKKEAYVSLTSDGKLSRFARDRHRQKIKPREVRCQRKKVTRKWRGG